MKIRVGISTAARRQILATAEGCRLFFSGNMSRERVFRRSAAHSLYIDSIHGLQPWLGSNAATRLGW